MIIIILQQPILISKGLAWGVDYPIFQLHFEKKINIIKSMINLQNHKANAQVKQPEPIQHQDCYQCHLYQGNQAYDKFQQEEGKLFQLFQLFFNLNYFDQSHSQICLIIIHEPFALQIKPYNFFINKTETIFNNKIIYRYWSQMIKSQSKSKSTSKLNNNSFRHAPNLNTHKVNQFNPGQNWNLSGRLSIQKQNNYHKLSGLISQRRQYMLSNQRYNYQPLSDRTRSTEMYRGSLSMQQMAANKKYNISNKNLQSSSKEKSKKKYIYNTPQTGKHRQTYSPIKICQRLITSLASQNSNNGQNSNKNILANSLNYRLKSNVAGNMNYNRYNGNPLNKNKPYQLAYQRKSKQIIQIVKNPIKQQSENLQNSQMNSSNITGDMQPHVPEKQKQFKYISQNSDSIDMHQLGNYGNNFKGQGNGSHQMTGLGRRQNIQSANMHMHMNNGYKYTDLVENDVEMSINDSMGTKKQKQVEYRMQKQNITRMHQQIGQLLKVVHKTKETNNNKNERINQMLGAGDPYQYDIDRQIMNITLSLDRRKRFGPNRNRVDGDGQNREKYNINEINENHQLHEQSSIRQTNYDNLTMTLPISISNLQMLGTGFNYGQGLALTDRLKNGNANTNTSSNVNSNINSNIRINTNYRNYHGSTNTKREYEIHANVTTKSKDIKQERQAEQYSQHRQKVYENSMDYQNQQEHKAKGYHEKEFTYLMNSKQNSPIISKYNSKEKQANRTAMKDNRVSKRQADEQILMDISNKYRKVYQDVHAGIDSYSQNVHHPNLTLNPNNQKIERQTTRKNYGDFNKTDTNTKIVKNKLNTNIKQNGYTMTTAPVLKTNLGYNNDIVISKIMNTDKSNADLDLRIQQSKIVPLQHIKNQAHNIHNISEPIKSIQLSKIPQNIKQYDQYDQYLERSHELQNYYDKQINAKHNNSYQTDMMEESSTQYIGIIDKQILRIRQRIQNSQRITKGMESKYLCKSPITNKSQKKLNHTAKQLQRNQQYQLQKQNAQTARYKQNRNNRQVNEISLNDNFAFCTPKNDSSNLINNKSQEINNQLDNVNSYNKGQGKINKNILKIKQNQPRIKRRNKAKQHNVQNQFFKKLAELFDQQISKDIQLRNLREQFMNYKLTEPARIVNNRKNTGTVINKNENDEKNDKWVVLNKKLQKQGYFYTVNQLKQLLQISTGQTNPFNSIKEIREDRIYLEQLTDKICSLFIKSQNYWNAYINGCVQNYGMQISSSFGGHSIDLNKKGYICIEDIVCYVNLFTGKFYKNRDAMLIFKRFCRRTGEDVKKNMIEYRNFQDIICGKAKM